MNEYHLNCEAGSLGDIIAATAVFKNGRTGSVTLTDEPKIRNFASVFDGIAEVRFVPSVTVPIPLAGTGPTSRRILSALGIKDYAVPYVLPLKENVEWAIQWLKDRDIKQPVVINGTIGGVNASDHPLRFYRKIDHNSMQEIVDEIVNRGFSPLTFGTSSNQERFIGALATPDLPITKLAALYFVIRRYIGCDTGDYHLMLAVGGRCITLIPDNAWHYRYDLHLYEPRDFPPIRPDNPDDPANSRVRYRNFKEYKSILN